VQSLEDCAGLHRVADVDALARWVDAMRTTRRARDAMGRAAAAAGSRYADLPDRTAAALLALLPGPAA